MEEYKRAYSGKPGCMCGCKGKYHEAGTLSATRLYKKIMKLATERPIEVVEVDECEQYLYVETMNINSGSRHAYAIYYK